MPDLFLDFKKAYTSANEILYSSKTITSFPFSPKKLIKEKSGIVCRSYEKALEYGVDIHDFGSDSATIFEYHGKNIIFYDQTKPEPHINFSLLHEFGHYYLKHDLNEKRNDVYGKYEIETNFFSAQILMPEQILRECIKRGAALSYSFLQQKFGVSREAAEKRMSTLARTESAWRSRQEKEFDDVILLKYSAFIDSISPKSSYFDYEYEEEMQSKRNSWY